MICKTKKFRFIGIVALAAIITLAGCGDPGSPFGGGGSPSGGPGGGGTGNEAANQTPVAAHFSFGNLAQYAGGVTAVDITPNAGMSQGAITVFFNSSPTLPQVPATNRADGRSGAQIQGVIAEIDAESGRAVSTRHISDFLAKPQMRNKFV